MKNSYTEIAFVLDRSGSMQGCRAAAMAGFNGFLQDQRQVEGLARLTLVLFDDQYETPVQALPIPEVLPLDDETFVPRGATALLDAIGRTIDELGMRLAAMVEADRPGQVIVAVLTDGLENSSQTYTWREIARLIKHQTEQYQWRFLFLGAGQDAIATAAQMNLPANCAATWVADAPGTRSSFRALQRKVGAWRRARAPGATAADLNDAAAPVSELLREEESRGDNA